MLITQNINRLGELKSLIDFINELDFIKSDEMLSGATIGQHIRHIIEFYQCIVHESSSGKIYYDGRKRDHRIEMDKDFAKKAIDEVISGMHEVRLDKPIIIQASYVNIESDIIELNSSFGRELSYALDHMIHHLAILKISMRFRGYELDENLGVAPSTVRYREEKCAQ